MSQLKKDYVTIENINGQDLRTQEKMFTNYLPDTIVSHIPIELQELSYSFDGRGHRMAYGLHRNESIDFSYPDFPSPLKAKLHKHNYFEIILVYSGHLNMQIESQFCQLNQWDVCLLNCHTRHAEHFIPGCKIVYLVIPPEYIENWPNEFAVNLNSLPLLSSFFINDLKNSTQYNKDYILNRYKKTGESSLLPDLIDELKKEFELKRPGYSLMIRGLLFRLLALLFQEKYYDFDYIDLGADQAFPLAYSTKKILDRCKFKVRIQDLSDQLNYSGEHINRIFKRHYGQSIPDYNRQVCMTHAAHLLTTSTMSIHTICQQLGYTNRTHFYALFKKTYNCTPSEYRAKHQ